MPPLVGVAVNVTEVPAHMVVTGVPIETEGVTDWFTVIIIALEVALGVEAHEEFDVSTQVTVSLLAKALSV